MATAKETPLLTPKHGFVLPRTRCGRKKVEIVVEDATGPGLSGAETSGPTLVPAWVTNSEGPQQPLQEQLPRMSAPFCWAYLRRSQIPPYTQQRTEV